MGRIDLLWDAWEDCLCKEQLRAEFNKLTAENEKLSCGEWIKPPPCPECHGTKYINRVVAVTDWELHPVYVIVDCLNCSGAKG